MTHTHTNTHTHTQPDGVILGVDTPDQWTECAIKGSAKEISAPSSVIGTNLLDAVSPFYKKLFAAVLKRVSDGRSSVVGWRYCADSPGTCRHCMLWIVRVGDGDVSFSSAQFDEHIRHPVFEDGFVEDEAGVVDICGWCKKLKYRDGTKWQSPDTFHNAMTQLGVAPPRALHVKHIACETCAKELSHNGMAWVPFLPRAITDAHSRASLVCCSSDHLLLRELVVRVCATRPWHGVIFPVLPDLPPGVPPGTPHPETPGCPALQMEVARECVRVFVLSNPSCGAIATDEPCLAEWFNEVCCHCCSPPSLFPPPCPCVSAHTTTHSTSPFPSSAFPSTTCEPSSS